MSSANLTRAETSTRSAATTVRGYRVEVDLRAARDRSMPTFPTTTTIELDSTVPATWIDFIGASVDSVTLNGKSVPVRYDGARILVDGLQPSNVLTIRANARYSTSGEGLHRFVDPVDDQTYLYTQYEPADARRVFACFEQPDMKAPYVFVVHAPEGWEVVSNQSVAALERDETGQHVTFAPTLPISTYITAIVAGPYHRATGEFRRGDDTIPLGVLCRASLAKHLDADEIIGVTRAGLEFFSASFDYPYPWGKYDQVFVPEYNLGAMENPGCVTFTEAYVFRGASTPAQHEGRANTILHEMAHMWFGDLVTMRWWDDLWLKESFADYMGALATAEATQWPDAWVSFANRRKAWAYLQDQLPTTHPIVADIVDLEAAKLNFDGITYAKGAAVLKQLVSYVGRDAFFAGARAYFRAHAFGNTTLDDLLVALQDASGRQVRAWSAAWLETTGVTTLELGTDAAGASVIVPSDARPHRLAVGWYEADASGGIVRRRVREFDVAGEPVAIGEGDAALVLLNDGDLTYAKARLDARSLATVETSLSRVVDPLARGLVWSALWNATRDGELAASRYLAIVRDHAPAEANTGLLAAVLGNALFAIEHYVPSATRAAERARWQQSVWTALSESEPGGGAQLAWARALADAAAFETEPGGHARGDAAELSRRIRAILDGDEPGPAGLALDHDLRWRLWTALSATGNADVAALDAELLTDETASGRIAHLRARTARPDADVRAAAWHSAMDDRSLTNDELDATIAGFAAAGRRDLTEPFDDAYFAALRQVWAERSIEIAERIVIGLFPVSESLDPVDTWLAQNADAPGALLRLVTERRDHLARDLRVRAANAQRD